MKTTILYLFSILTIIILVPNITAENMTNETHENITLYAIDYFTLNYTDDNTTHYWPIECLINTSNGTGPLCEVDRTLNYGETYVRNDAYCNLDINCPDCECEEWENTSYYVHWKIYSDQDRIYITNLNNNESHDYYKGDNFSFEDEFEVHCPAVDECDKSSEWTPINITEEQWYWLCLEPFGKYGQTIKDLSTAMSDSQKSAIAELATCQESNKNLASNLATCEEKIIHYNKCNDDLTNCNDELEATKKLLTDCQKEQSGKSAGYTVSFIFNVIIGSILLFAIFYKLSEGYLHSTLGGGK